MAISKINWVGIDSSRKPTKFVHIGAKNDVEWTILCNEDTEANE